MIDSLVRSVESAFVDFNIRRLLYLAFVLSILVGSVLLFDYATGYSHYARLDSRINALERLHELKSEGISEDLQLIFEDAVRSLERNEHRPILQKFSISVNPEPFLRFFSATAFYLLMMIGGIIQWFQGNPDWFKLLAGSLFFVVILGVVGIALPTFGNVWTNVGIYALFQLLSLVALTAYGNRKRRIERQQREDRPVPQ
jgi:hypothetical protein